MTSQPMASRPSSLRSWPVPAALVALSSIPLIAGTLRLVQLAGGPHAIVGAFQFVARFRRRHLTWHRRAGRILTVAGLMVAASAVWMTLLYAQKPGTGDLLYVLRLVSGSAMAACLVLGFTAIRRRDIAAHRAWMIRAYAIGVAAGTQAFTGAIGGVRHTGSQSAIATTAGAQS